MNITRIIAILLASLVLSGCYAVKVKNIAPNRTPAVTDSVFVHTILWGLVPLNTVNAADSCGGARIMTVETKMNGIGVVANLLTCGLYSPMVANVTCAR